jgi:hypothetical protein
MESGQPTGEAQASAAGARAGGHPCPQASRDYLKLAAWMFALLFGPALVALVVWLS